MKFSSRVKERCKRELQSFGLFLPIRQLEFVHSGVTGKKLLIVGPGAITIPSLGWGAVETIISETLPNYAKLGHDIWLINSRHPIDWLRIKRIDFDVIICHSDFHASKLRRYFPQIPIFVISHYGLAAFKEKWHKSYNKTIQNLQSYTKLICLSPAVYETYSEYFKSEFLVLSPNGTTFKPSLNPKKNRKFLCIGKVEVRKRQYEIYQRFSREGIPIDFIGPIADERVVKLLKTERVAGESFPGPLSREELENRICAYEALILFSEGEGDALVLYEAQMAGLPIFVTKEALGSQDPSLPWVKIVEQNVSPSKLLKILSEIPNSQNDIMNYAKANYSWEKRNLSINTLIQEALSV